MINREAMETSVSLLKRCRFCLTIGEDSFTTTFCRAPSYYINHYVLASYQLFYPYCPFSNNLIIFNNANLI